MTGIRIISYNIRGLNFPMKRSAFRSEIRKLRGEILLIQETHLKQVRSPYLQSHYFPYVYRADAKNSKAGVAVLIGRSVDWQLIDTKSDEEGRWVVVNGKCFGKVISLVSIYAPNTGQVGFLEKTLENVVDAAKGIVIIGGDLNLPVDPKMDTSKGYSSSAISGHKRVKKILREHQLLDIWRITNPDERDYTYFSAVHGSYSRIDYVLMRHQDIPRVREIEIKIFTLSDHAPCVRYNMGGCV